MEKPTREEVYAAIAAYISDARHSNETFASIAQRLGVSISSLRRVASEYGIVRRQRLGKSVLERIERAHEEETR
jgi:NADH:ubiquinone oxidoreductase subunit E